VVYSKIKIREKLRGFEMGGQFYNFKRQVEEKWQRTKVFISTIFFRQAK